MHLRHLAVLFALLGPMGCGLGHADCPKVAAVSAKYEAPDERIVLFAIGNTDVSSPEASFELGYVVALLDERANMHALIVGHADPQGSPKVNQELSLRRARAVRQHLIKHGVKPERVMIATPHDASGPAGSGLNRRADVYVYDPLEEEASKRLGYAVEVRQE